MAEILYDSYYGVSSLGKEYLSHHGIKGQRWGIRRFQNEDGSLTDAGEKRYDTDRDKRTRNEFARDVARRGVSNMKNRKRITNMSDDDLKDILSRVELLEKVDNISKRRERGVDESKNRKMQNIKLAVATATAFVALQTVIKKNKAS